MDGEDFGSNNFLDQVPQELHKLNPNFIPRVFELKFDDGAETKSKPLVLLDSLNEEIDEYDEAQDFDRDQVFLAYEPEKNRKVLLRIHTKTVAGINRNESLDKQHQRVQAKIDAQIKSAPYAPAVYSQTTTDEKFGFSDQESGEHIVTVEEYIEGQNLDNYIAKNKPSESEILNILDQVAVAQFIPLKKEGVAQRDCHAKNFVFDPKTKKFRIVDYGASLAAVKNLPGIQIIGREGMIAPERFEGNAPTETESAEGRAVEARLQTYEVARMGWSFLIKPGEYEISDSELNNFKDDKKNKLHFRIAYSEDGKPINQEIETYKKNLMIYKMSLKKLYQRIQMNVMLIPSNSPLPCEKPWTCPLIEKKIINNPLL